MNAHAVADVAGAMPLIIPTDPRFVSVAELLESCDGFLLTGGRPNVHPSEYGEEETPLLQELEIMKNRPYDDIIIIDDCRLMGKKGTCGMGEDHPIYPTMDFDWSHITDDVITGLMKEGYVLLKNDNREYTDGPYDQYILVKPTSKIIN